MELIDRVKNNKLEALDILLWTIDKTHDYISKGEYVSAKKYYNTTKRIHMNYVILGKTSKELDDEFKQLGQRYRARFKVFGEI